MTLLALVLAAMSCMPLPTCTVPVTVSPCATPTPTLAWNQVMDADLTGYSLYFRDTGSGGAPSWLGDVLCIPALTDEDGVFHPFFCPGANLDVALQRWCPACAPYQSYEVFLKAFDSAGNLSVDYSLPVEVCPSPICVPPGPCN